MNRTPFLRILAVFLFTQTFPSEAKEQLDLKPSDWQITAAKYHIARVSDDRKSKGAVGKVTNGGVVTEIEFRENLEKDLYGLVTGSISQRTSGTAPLRISVEKFQILDNVIGNRRKIILQIHLKLFRDIEGAPKQLFELSASPEVTASGPKPVGFYEKMINDPLKEFMRQFNEWAEKNPDQPYFMNRIILRLFNDGAWPDPEQGDTIRWNADYKLKWNDFKGTNKSGSPFSAESNCMYSTKSTPSFSGDTMILRLIVHPCFTRSGSWVKTGSEQDSLLIHEQLHFDLCELYGRKFRKSAMELQLSLLQYDQQIRSEFEKFWLEYQTAQQLYDRETEHGIIRQEQNKWIDKTKKELDELELYK